MTLSTMAIGYHTADLKVMTRSCRVCLTDTNTPLPLRRSPPLSFKRWFRPLPHPRGGRFTTSRARLKGHDISAELSRTRHRPEATVLHRDGSHECGEGRSGRFLGARGQRGSEHKYEIVRASCRERVSISVDAVSLKKNIKKKESG